MRFEASLQRKAVVPRNEMLRLDCSSLYETTGQQAFARKVMLRVNLASAAAMPTRAALEVGKEGWVALTVTATATPGHTQIDPKRPSLTGACNGGNADDPVLFASFTAMHGDHWWYDDHLYQCYHAAAVAPPSTADSASPSTIGSPSLSMPPPSVPYSRIADALRETATEMLPKKPKPQPAWFDARAAELERLITQLNTTLNAHHLSPSPETAAA
eukprot:4524192-Prymnesium_polylepis.1